MTENKALETTKNNLPAESDDWGAADNLDANDVLISKIYHQQALSKLVDKGVAQTGDWCDSLTDEILCKRESKLEVIVFASYKNMLVSKLNEQTDKYEWLRTETVTAENSALPYREETAEGKISRQIQYNYFCMIPGRMDDMPRVLSMSSTKTKAAKKINFMFMKLKKLKKSSASFVIELLSVKEQKGKNTWYGADVTQGRPTTPEELAICKEYYLQSRTHKFIVQETNEANEAGAAASAASSDDMANRDDDMPF